MGRDHMEPRPVVGLSCSLKGASLRRLLLLLEANSLMPVEMPPYSRLSFQRAFKSTSQAGSTADHTALQSAPRGQSSSCGIWATGRLAGSSSPRPPTHTPFPHCVT